MNKKKVCLYARVSTDQQSTGLEAQVRALKEYCTRNGITEYEIFADEKWPRLAFSATKTSAFHYNDSILTRLRLFQRSPPSV